MIPWREQVDAGRWSIGAAVAWQVAAAEAVRQSHEAVEPLHLFVGIFSLEKVLQGEVERDFGISKDAAASLRAECGTLAKVFAKLDINQAFLRRAARAEIGNGSRSLGSRDDVGPSPATSAVLSLASQTARQRDGDSVGLTHILMSLLECRSSRISEFLGRCRVPVQMLADAVRNAASPPKNPVEDVQRPEPREQPQRGGATAQPSDLHGSTAAVGKESLVEEPITPPTDRSIAVNRTMAIDNSTLVYTGANADRMRSRLALLYELPLQFAEQQDLEPLFDTIVERLLSVIPGAKRGALLLFERPSGRLLLKAHRPAGRPAVSLTLAGRTMEQREGFIWCQEQDPSASMIELSCMSGMYAPLIWRDEVLGVVCVDNPSCKRPFEEDDLRLLLAVARYAAMALANRRLQEDLQLNATLLGRLLTTFSPAVRDALLKKARQGRLRLGGEKSEVTILCSDIRGFTRMSADLDADEIVDMLNSYFPALVEALFRFKGTIDKYVGDAILAVFGSPEPDPGQHENAISAAAEMQSAMNLINAERRKRGLTTCDIGIGLHCGEVLHGFIGAPDRIEFTVIGDAVNKTARYCDGAQAGEILISPRLHEHAWQMINAEPISVSTKHEGALQAYRLKGLKSR